MNRVWWAGKLLLRDPLFQLGLALRIVLVMAVSPATHVQWFVPFLRNAATSGIFTPYSAHFAAQGDPLAFPYGVVMYLVLFPLVAVGTALDTLIGTTGLAAIGLNLTVLLLDAGLLVLLLLMKETQTRRILVLYWLSPIVLYICYWHGQLDIVPIFLLVLSLYLLFQQQALLSGLVLAAAVSSKFSMVLAGPIILLFLLASRRRHALLVPWIGAGAAATILLHLPILLSPSARTMVYGTPELAKVYEFSIQLSNGLQIYLLPVAYALLLLSAWFIRRISAELLIALLGVGFLVIVIMTPASPGWYLWFVPFAALIFATARRHHVIFVGLFGLAFVTFHLLRSQGAFLPLFAIDLSAPRADRLNLGPHDLSLLISLLTAGGIVLCLLLLREGILRNDFFRLSRRPLMIGIAGDSGSGKDALADSITSLIGKEAVCYVSGDDYHLWDRHKPMWQVMTHLNPNANDLPKFRQDVTDLAAGKTIRNRHYDHSKGRIRQARNKASNEVIIAAGLHALYDPELCRRYDVRIFLDMDDRLRTFLKIQRDAYERGHTVDGVLAALKNRQQDREHFIQPQMDSADLIFSLMPLRAALVSDVTRKAELPKLKLRVQMQRTTPHAPLVRSLIGICGLHVDVAASGEFVDLTIEGDVYSHDVEFAARNIASGLEELLDHWPTWHAGPTGLMQLFTLNQIAHGLRQRLQ